MSPPTARSRPAGGGSEDSRLAGGSSASTIAAEQDEDVLARQLARRREAGWRLPPLDDSGVRDPWLRLVGPPRPTTYGLTYPERVAEARRLQSTGWANWEITKRLDMRRAA